MTAGSPARLGLAWAALSLLRLDRMGARSPWILPRHLVLGQWLPGSDRLCRPAACSAVAFPRPWSYQCPRARPFLDPSVLGAGRPLVSAASWGKGCPEPGSAVTSHVLTVEGQGVGCAP